MIFFMDNLEKAAESYDSDKDIERSGGAEGIRIANAIMRRNGYNFDALRSGGGGIEVESPLVEKADSGYGGPIYVVALPPAEGPLMKITGYNDLKKEGLVYGQNSPERAIMTHIRGENPEIITPTLHAIRRLQGGIDRYAFPISDIDPETGERVDFQDAADRVRAENILAAKFAERAGNGGDFRQKARRVLNSPLSQRIIGK
jgi:hypothetical protein